MERCPICRARLKGGAHCTRCGADLASAQAAERYADHAVSEALHALGLGDRQRALRCLSASLMARRTPLAAHLYTWLTSS